MKLNRDPISICGYFLVVCLILAVVNALGGRAFADNTKQMTEIKEEYTKLLNEKCDIIGKYTSSCYSGDRSACTQLREGVTWFQGKDGFKSSPEELCTADTGAF